MPLAQCLTIVIPVLNEAETIAHFLDAARPPVAEALAMMGGDALAEFLFVDDGSTDATPDILLTLAQLHGDIRAIRLSRNFGKEAALAAGLRHATGDAVIPMDVDLQDPPGVVPQMVRLWLDGAKVVNARRADRSSDSWFKRSSAKGFYRVINAIAETPIPENVGDFRLLDRVAVDVVNRLGERARFNKGLFSWVGFKQAEVTYVRDARTAGTTKWRPWGLWRLALDGITASSTVPLRIWTYVGAIVALAALGYAGFLIVHTMITGVQTPGYASIMVTMLLLGAVNLLGLGFMGEYVGRIAKEVRARPLYIIEADTADVTGGADPARVANPGEIEWTEQPMRG